MMGDTCNGQILACTLAAFKTALCSHDSHGPQGSGAHCDRLRELRRLAAFHAAGHWVMLQLGNAALSLATPLAVTFVSVRSSCRRFDMPSRFCSPASVRRVPPSRTFLSCSKLFRFTRPSFVRRDLVKSSSRSRVKGFRFAKPGP